MPLRVLVTAAIAALMLACGKGPPPVAPSDPANATAPAEERGTADEASAAGLLADLTQAVRKFSAEQRRVPKDLEELVSQGYLGHVPPAPAGMTFAINKNLQVYLRSH
jgi:hypothetical protein